jgi:hypothetical protein
LSTKNSLSLVSSNTPEGAELGIDKGVQGLDRDLRRIKKNGEKD